MTSQTNETEIKISKEEAKVLSKEQQELLMQVRKARANVQDVIEMSRDVVSILSGKEQSSQRKAS